MTRRSRAREVALQLLVQRDLNASPDRELLVRFVHERLHDPGREPFTLALVDGVAQQAAEIDRHIAGAADNWRVQRMAVVDRNVLRLAAYELLFTPETPAAVVIDEAVELGRRFGSADSPAFVNGVLDRLRLTVANPA